MLNPMFQIMAGADEVDPWDQRPTLLLAALACVLLAISFLRGERPGSSPLPAGSGSRPSKGAEADEQPGA